jgi:hypothetical protein
MSKNNKRTRGIGTFGEIGVALTQSRAHTWLGLGRNPSILSQRDRGPRRKGDKSLITSDAIR